MKKIAIIGILLCILLGIAACDMNKELSFAVTEISIYDFPELPSQITLTDGNPCVLVVGEAYIHDGECWNKIQADKNFTEMYSGEIFCALTEDGEIFVTENAFSGYEEYPLGSAGVYHNAEKLLQDCGDTPIEHISANILNDYVIASYADGGIRVYVNGMEQVIAEPIRVADMSGKYLLSEGGEVYVVSYPDAFDWVKVKLVSEEKFVSISACSTANRCIGIKQDGSVEVWSDVEGELASDFRDIEKINMGFNHCVALSEDGEVCFASYDEEQEGEIREYLKTLDGKAIDVTCAYNKVAILLKDGSVCMIEL